MEDWGLVGEEPGCPRAPRMEGPPGEAVFRGGNGSGAEVLLVDTSSMPSPGQGSPTGSCWAGHWASKKPLKRALNRHLWSRGLRVSADQPRESAGRTGLWL